MKRLSLTVFLCCFLGILSILTGCYPLNEFHYAFSSGAQNRDLRAMTKVVQVDERGNPYDATYLYKLENWERENGVPKTYMMP